MNRQTAAGSVPKPVKRFARTLGKQTRYTLREFNIINRLGKLANGRISQEVLEKMQELLKELKREEFREQIMASANKLISRMEKMLKLHMFSAETKGKLESLVGPIKVFYGKLLVDTVDGLEKEIRGKKVNQVNWKVVREIIARLNKDIRALTAIDEQARQAIRLKA